MKFHLLICLILVFSCSNTLAQDYHQKNDKIQTIGTIGLAVGQENLVSLPKLSGFASIKLGKKTNSKFGNWVTKLGRKN